MVHCPFTETAPNPDVGSREGKCDSSQKWRMLIAFVALSISLGGCVLGKFSRLESNMERFAGTSALTGTVLHRASDRARIIVAVFQEHNGVPEFIYTTRLLNENFFLFLVEPGKAYYLVAFDDRDGNMAYTKGEAVGMCGSPFPKILKVDEANKYARCRITIVKRGSIPDAFATSLAQAQLVRKSQVPLVAGEVANIDDVRFSQAYGEMGLWAPFDFIRQVGAGIYFLEPYDANKIPILFVNGAGGYPQEWKYFVNNIDRNKYQPWLYLYPSGARLETAGRTLDMFIKSLHKRHRFNTLYVTAHSMGGLVARDFIIRNRHNGKSDYIKLFISISTPWGGHEAAELGAKYSPATIPSWIDLQTDSDFQKQIFSKPLNSRVNYYLFFGHKGSPGIFTGNNDGTVSMASMLRTEAQKDSMGTYGFDEDHTSILQSPAVLQTYTKLLNPTR